MSKHSWVRTIYLYLFALLGLVLVVIGLVRLINLGLKVYIFTEAERETYRYMPAPTVPGDEDKQTLPKDDKIITDHLRANRQREAAGALSFLIVGLPLYLYHWMVIKKDKRES